MNRRIQKKHAWTPGRHRRPRRGEILWALNSLREQGHPIALVYRVGRYRPIPLRERRDGDMERVRGSRHPAPRWRQLVLAYRKVGKEYVNPITGQRRYK